MGRRSGRENETCSNVMSAVSHGKRRTSKALVFVFISPIVEQLGAAYPTIRFGMILAKITAPNAKQN